MCVNLQKIQHIEITVGKRRVKSTALYEDTTEFHGVCCLTYMVDVKALPFFTNCKGVGGGGRRGWRRRDNSSQSFQSRAWRALPNPHRQGAAFTQGFLIWPLWGDGGGGWLSSCLSAWRRETTTVTVGMWASRSSDPNGAWRRCYLGGEKHLLWCHVTVSLHANGADLLQKSSSVNVAILRVSPRVLMSSNIHNAGTHVHTHRRQQLQFYLSKII